MTTSPPHSPTPAPLSRPLMIYDGDCPLCHRWIERWRALTGDKIDYAPSQSLVGFSRIPPEALGKSIWLVETDGRLRRGAEAVFRALSLAGETPGYFWAYRRLPGFAKLADRAYSWVSHHRAAADRIDLALFRGKPRVPRSRVLTRAIFLRALGAIYLIAFLSLWGQIDGLAGSHGILPVHAMLDAVAAHFPTLSPVGRFLQTPTLCWISASDGFLHFLCAGGAVLSCCLIAGLAPLPILFLLWLFYLSLVQAGQDFLAFQWDILLLEAGFLAMFLAPPTLRLRPALLRPRPIPRNVEPSRIAIFLFRWLLFRLIFLSGLVKYLASDPAWRDLTAMQFHYETQPLPTWTSWYAFWSPHGFAPFSTGCVLVIEAIVPFLFFAPRRLRLFACAVTVLFQLLIAATGNFGFFNLLTIVLCVLLLDDSIWGRWGARRAVAKAPARPSARSLLITIPAAALLIPLSIIAAVVRVGGPQWMLQPFLLQAYSAVAPFGSVNGYGLFEDMTRRRPELSIEGSNDGVHWLEYQFKWKPDRLDRRPRFCTPQMPRLDWQMWFASQRIYNDNMPDPWLSQFLMCLRNGSIPVTRLLANNPFPEHPPMYVRANLYLYWFSTPAQRAATGDWWQRDLVQGSTLVAGPPRKH